jgi:hypothetical protein
MVTAPVTASERDLRALAAIVTEDRPDLPAREGLPPSLLDDLLGLIPGDCLTVMGLDSGRQENWFGYDVPVEDDFDIVGDASPEEFWDNYRASDSCCYPDRTGGRLRPPENDNTEWAVAVDIADVRENE